MKRNTVYLSFIFLATSLCTGCQTENSEKENYVFEAYGENKSSVLTFGSENMTVSLTLYCEKNDGELSLQGEEEKKVLSYAVTWSMDNYGYEISIDDERKTVVHTDYDQYSAYHSFYYLLDYADTETQLCFRKKDTAFLKTLPDDFITAYERLCQYKFCQNSIYYSNEKQRTFYLYLLNDSNKTVMYQRDDYFRIAYGWTFQDDAFDLVLQGNHFTSKHCTEEGKNGYRLENITPDMEREPYTEVYPEYFYYVVDDFDYNQYTSEDFR